MMSGNLLRIALITNTPSTPFPVPSRPWEDLKEDLKEDLSLDFIEELLAYRGHNAILMVVDHFSKGIHLGMLHSHYTAHSVALLFMELVGKIHGMPQSLVSDHDPLSSVASCRCYFI